MQEAVLAEANRLGIRYSGIKPQPITVPWPYLPERGELTTSERVSISLRITVAELMTIAAEYVNTSETQFIVGSTLAYIGRLQRCYRGMLAASPEEAQEARAALQKIRLPQQYRYGAHRKASAP